MAAKVKFFVTNPKGKTKSKKKVDEINILVRFSNGRQFDLIAKTQKQIKPNYWNNEKGIVRDIAEFEEKDDFQKSLNKLERHIIKEFDNTSDKSKINKAWLDKTIDKCSNPDKYLQKNLTLFQFIQHFIDNSEKRVNPDTGNPVCYKMRREYQVTFDYLKKYAKKNKKELDFIDIDLEFYQQFVDFLRNYEERDKNGKVIKSGLAINTIGKKIQTLKIFLNAATEQGINKFMKYKSRNFKTLSEESDNIYLTKEELNQFYEHDFSNKPYLERVRDLFIVAAWTGVRYSDIQQIKSERIADNIFTLKQQKTGKKAVIPINGIVWNIINKYNEKLPKPISNQKFNHYLKEAARTAELNSVFIKTKNIKGMRIEKKYPKHEVISTHTARRSFCTNAYKDGIPTLSIMAISGHKTEKAFLKYIKVDGEEHAKKVLEMWQKNGEFMKVAK
jgi:site-specific recombinase XerD